MVECKSVHPPAYLLWLGGSGNGPSEALKCPDSSHVLPKGVERADRRLRGHRPGGCSETRAGEFAKVEGGAETTPRRTG